MCKNLIAKTFLLTVLLFVTSCAKQDRGIQILRIDPRTATAHELNDVLCVTGITVLECNDSAFIGEVSDYLNYKNRSYVLDKKSKCIHVFRIQESMFVESVLMVMVLMSIVNYLVFILT